MCRWWLGRRPTEYHLKWRQHFFEPRHQLQTVHTESGVSKEQCFLQFVTILTWTTDRELDTAYQWHHRNKPRKRHAVTLTFDLLIPKPKQLIFDPRCTNDKSLVKIYRCKSSILQKQHHDRTDRHARTDNVKPWCLRHHLTVEEAQKSWRELNPYKKTTV